MAYACMHVRMYVCLYVRMHICMYVCMYVRMHIIMYVCTHVYTYVCIMYECICVYEMDRPRVSCSACDIPEAVRGEAD